MSELALLLRKWQENPHTGHRIVAFGSSNTELFHHCQGRHNWVDWLNITIREHIGQQVLIINQGVCGDTAPMLLRRLHRDITPLSPAMVIVTIGGNDAIWEFTPQEYEENLRSICEKIRFIKALPVLQTYFCPLYNEMGPDFTKLFTEYVLVNRNLAAKLQIPVIDQYCYFEPFYREDPATYRRLMRDGLHLNPVGNAIMGLIAARHFGLPAPTFPEDLKREVYYYMGIIERNMSSQLTTET